MAGDCTNLFQLICSLLPTSFKNNDHDWVLVITTDWPPILNSKSVPLMHTCTVHMFSLIYFFLSEMEVLARVIRASDKSEWNIHFQEMISWKNRGRKGGNLGRNEKKF